MSKIKILSSFFLAVSGGAIWSAPAWAVECPSVVPAIEITAEFKKAVPMINNQISQGRLASKSGRAGFHAKTLGLTESRLTVRILTSYSIRYSPQSRYACVTLETVHIEYGFGQTPVLIDRRYRPGSCEYGVIYNHESGHVRIMNNRGNRYQSWVKRQVAQRVQTIRPVQTSRPKQAKEAMEKQIKAITERLAQQMNKSLAAAHAVIDTPENYKRTQSQCQNW
ncbi:MAG: hypothetical protein HQL67_07095 [Magnetococcales bacterium]|nr:hypothetical protein [Magnetococcales bacterium]